MSVNNKSTRSNLNVRNLTVTAMLSAVAFILMFFEVSLPVLIPSFIKMDISDLPALLGTFSLGPVYGVLIELLKNVLHIVFKGTSTACAGEVSNFLIGAMFVFPAGMIYKHHKNRKFAVISCVIGAVVMAVLSVPINYFISYPAYVKFFGLPLDVIIGMYKAIFAGADSLLKCLVIFNVPFNLAKGIINMIICCLIYKPLSPVLKGRK